MSKNGARKVELTFEKWLRSQAVPRLTANIFVVVPERAGASTRKEIHDRIRPGENNETEGGKKGSKQSGSGEKQGLETSFGDEKWNVQRMQ